MFSVDEFLLEEAPLWWEKLKKPKVQELMAKADQLCSLPPRRDTTPAVRDYPSSAIDALNEEPTNAPEVDPLMIAIGGSATAAAGGRGFHRPEGDGHLLQGGLLAPVLQAAGS